MDQIEYKLIDFLSSKLLYRAKHASLRKEALARAIGVRPKDNPTIVDATAGLGQDSYILACLGYHVTMLEKSPTVYELLNNALTRARADSSDNPCHRLTLIHADALSWLPANPKHDVIYLDPMFPERRKTAAAKKSMQLLQAILPQPDNIQTLIQTSLACAGKRVVVKRPRLATNATDLKPSFSLSGNSTRFDIYLV